MDRNIPGISSEFAPGSVKAKGRIDVPAVYGAPTQLFLDHDGTLFIVGCFEQGCDIAKRTRTGTWSNITDTNLALPEGIVGDGQGDLYVSGFSNVLNGAIVEVLRWCATEHVDGSALGPFVTNKVHGNLLSVAVCAPGFGHRRLAERHDIAAFTGGRVITENGGLNLANITLATIRTFCGSASRGWRATSPSSGSARRWYEPSRCSTP